MGEGRRLRLLLPLLWLFLTGFNFTKDVLTFVYMPCKPLRVIWLKQGRSIVQQSISNPMQFQNVPTWNNGPKFVPIKWKMLIDWQGSFQPIPNYKCVFKEVFYIMQILKNPRYENKRECEGRLIMDWRGKPYWQQLPYHERNRQYLLQTTSSSEPRNLPYEL